MPQPSPTDPLLAQAETALRLLERYRHLDPVVAFGGLGLRPAVEAYARALEAVPEGPATRAARRAAQSQLLRTRIDLWATLLARDVPGYLDGLPGPRGPARDAALQQRAARMVALCQARTAAGRPLPYGTELVRDLEAALREMDPPETRARAVLRRELHTMQRLLRTLLGSEHADALALSRVGGEHGAGPQGHRERAA